jgi:predicted ArsR family transcriptional regulator
MSSDRSDRAHRAPRPTADRLLVLLKTRGPRRSADLSADLGISGEATRQQLAKLSAEGLVEATAEEARGVGRPSQVWRLTAAGHARFPDSHAELSAQLIGSIRRVLGEPALERLIAAREAEMRASYAALLDGEGALEQRIARLSAQRSREGYMAEWRAEGDGYLFIENHCPICVAATACQGFCRSELELFSRLLGPGVKVTRLESIVEGSRRCTYRIERT